jgi:hypothetical protein
MHAFRSSSPGLSTAKLSQSSQSINSSPCYEGDDLLFGLEDLDDEAASKLLEEFEVDEYQYDGRLGDYS